jgi:hypothetical protein
MKSEAIVLTSGSSSRHLFAGFTLLVLVRLLTALQLETMKSCYSFLLPGGSWSLVAANGRGTWGTCMVSRPMLLAASGTCEIWWLPLD